VARPVPGTVARIPAGTVHAIDADPRVPSRLLAATGGGVLESRDGGASWSVVAVGSGRDEAFAVAVAQPVTQSPRSAALPRLFAGRRDGLWRSDDGGRSWALMPPPGEAGGVPVAIAVGPSPPHSRVVRLLHDEGRGTKRGDRRQHT